MTTSPGPVAQRPDWRRNAVSFAAPGAVESKPSPKYGPSPTGLPSSPMIFAWSETSPTAVPTCGTAADLGELRDASMLGRWIV